LIRPAVADLAHPAGTARLADQSAGFVAVDTGWVDHVQMTTGLPSPGRVRLARALAWPALLLPPLTLVLHLANTDTPVHTWWGGFVVIAAGLGAMGSLLAIRLPDNPIGWIFLAGSLGQGLAGAGREWAVLGFATHPGSLPLADWAAWLGWASTISLASFPLALLRLPDGRLPGLFERLVQGLVVGAATVSIAASALAPGEYTDELPGLANPIGIDWAPIHVAELVSWIALSLSVLLGAVSLGLRWWRGGPERRRSLRWVVVAASLLAVEIVLENSPLTVLGMFDWLGPLVFLIFVTTVTVCVLRYRLWDIDVLVDISLAYGIVTVVIGGAFVALVAITGRTLDQRDIFWPSLIAVAVFALSFVPLRNRIRGWIERVRHGSRSDPYAALDLLGRQEEATDLLPEAVRLAQSQSPLLDHVAVTPLGGQRVASGTVRGEVMRSEVTYAGQTVGTLEVSYRPGTTPGRAAALQLAELRERLGAVLHAAHVRTAVSESRRAVAVAREEERRRLRRDLHDGLGPALAAVALRVDGARALLDDDQTRAATVLAAVSADVRSTIDDIRRLVYDLQPPILDSIGLLAAIGEQAAAFSGQDDGDGRLAVDIAAPPQLPDLPAAVEVAAYRIVCEALANVARHAEASCCRIGIDVDATAGALTLTVDDDGNGRGGRERPGVGTASMIERAGELGGSCSIGTAPLGGTRVFVTLPLRD
jgi:signal transduction histidine kinase